jgi:hypothetical protein
MAEGAPALAANDLADAAAAFAAAAERAAQVGRTMAITNAELAAVITAALKLYAAKVEAEGGPFAPVAPDKATPTEVVLVVSEMLRALDISLFDLAMWYRRGG